MSGTRYMKCKRQIALALACLVPLATLVLLLASARAIAAPQSPISNLQSPIPNTQYPVCFYRDGAPVCVNRPGAQASPSIGEQARDLLEVLLAGPTGDERALGLRSALPQEAKLADVIVVGDDVTVKLVLPESFLYGSFDSLVSDEINTQIIKTLYPVKSLRKFHVLALDPRDQNGAFKSLAYFLFEPQPVHKESAPVQAASPVTTGVFLSGKAVYLSAGHGWYWNSTLSDWRTQRPAYEQIIEDMNNAEVVNQYLVPYLRNAGADVWPVREQDMNAQEIIVTHNSPAYSETGVWLTSTLPGYQALNYRYAAVVTSSAAATATWTFTPTASGRYAVYTWYKLDPNNAPDAQYLIVHAGGTTEARVNQQIHGETWHYIGTFSFLAGAPGKVMLTNQSATTDTNVVADAVRVGGGMGTLQGGEPPASPGPSGKPRWEEASRYYSKYMGAPSSVYAPVGCSTDDCFDVTARPRYAEWERSSSEDAVFVSWHTNGSGINARGTESYIYDGAWGGTFVTGSDRLQYWVHTALVDDIRAGWEAGWQDRNMLQGNYGEVRVLTTMPGTLLEIAFHDEPNDAAALRDPRFAQLTARAVYKGIVRFYAEKDSVTPVFLPEPPRNLIVRNSGPGQVVVSWRPSLTDTIGLLGDAATGYRVYTSSDGLGWDNGTPVAGTLYTLTGLAPNQLVFVRVTATNAGGESFPTAVAAARVAESGAAPVLLVYGYERIDRYMDIEQCDTPTFANCPNQRIWPAQMNDQSYIVQHAQAISLPLDSAMRGALDSRGIALDRYSILVWIAGQEQTPASIPNGTAEVALTAAERVSFTAYLNSGHSLLISGAEVAFDLVTNLNAQVFLAGTLRAQFVNDDAATFAVTPMASGILSGLASFSFDDGSHGTYPVLYPDILTPTNGSAAMLSYVGGRGGTAAIQYASGCQRLVYLGFPFETIYPALTRQTVMSRMMSFLSACLDQSSQAVILSPANGGYYNHTPAINGLTSGGAPADHVDVAMVDIANSRFLSATSWVTAQTWMSATGSATWAFTPSVSLADGPYAVWARAWTTSGLSSTYTAIVSFTMDTLSPTVPVIITPTGGGTVPSPVTLVFTPSYDANGVAGYTLHVDGKLYTTTATSFAPGGLWAGSHTWSVRAFDAAGNASDWAMASFTTSVYLVHLPLVLRDYAPLPPITRCQELVSNGGFETQDVWYSLSITKPTYVTTPTHGGLASLLIGLTTTPPVVLYSSIQQTITIPLTATATTLTFWRYPVSGDLTGDYEYLAVGSDPKVLSTIWITRTNEQTWVTTTVDLSAYHGLLTVRFGVYNNGTGGVTAMYLDDVSVQSCGQ